MPKSIPGVLREFKDKALHSGGSGKVVTNPKQAIAIALSEQRQKPAQAPRHRLAGSHDGMYVTEHHRSAKR